MSNRTIKAPGVEIFEHDMSDYPTISEGTHVLIAGFAQKGEDYEPYELSSRSSWLKFYGAPTNEAEEYFYAAANEVIDKGGFLHSVKIPYDNDIKGIYAAAKFVIEENRDLLEREPDGEFFLNLDGTENLDINNGTDAARLMDQYQGLKKLGINSLSKIAPQGQDFLSYDLVEEYENGERKPGTNVIYIVDKTRAIYERAVKVEDVQDNRDARACLGILPVITTLANTAWFQKASTRLEADIKELYQPIRSIKTITFPAGAASAAEYQPTYLTSNAYTEEVTDKKGKKKTITHKDLSVDVVQELNSYDRSIAEMVAMQAQSCLVDGNMVDGKFAPFVCNDVAVIVLKAFISTEDSRIDFEVVEQFVGSLDPAARNEKGLSTYIGTLINNTSDYIYFFSNLKNPKTVLKSDHAFVAGSNSAFDEIEDKIREDPDYIAAQTFGGYTARMLGFDDNDIGESQEEWTFGSLRSFYNQNEKQKVSKTDELTMGDYQPGWEYDEMTDDCTSIGTDDRDYAVEKVIHGDVMHKAFENKKFVIDENFIVKKPIAQYTIGKDYVFICSNPECPSNKNHDPSEKPGTVHGVRGHGVYDKKKKTTTYYCEGCGEVLAVVHPGETIPEDVILKDEKGNNTMIKSYGAIDINIISPKSVSKPKEAVKGEEYYRVEDDNSTKCNYTLESYDYKIRIGRTSDEANIIIQAAEEAGHAPYFRDASTYKNMFADVAQAEYAIPESWQDEKFFQLSIFNSTDYLRAITEFENLVNVGACVATPIWENYGRSVLDPFNNKDDMQFMRDIMTRILIINSVEKTAKFKIFLRRLKKDQVALDRLDDAMATFVSSTTKNDFGDYTARIYVRDLYNSLNQQGLLGGIMLVDTKAQTDSSAGISELMAKSADLEVKIENLVNPDTTKAEKAEPKKRGKKSSVAVARDEESGDESTTEDPEEIVEKLRKYKDDGTIEYDYPTWYARCRIYLRHKLYSDYKDMFDYITDVLDDCAMAADRYLQSQQSIDDSNVMLGFYPEMAEPIITYTEIAQTINKLYDTFGDLNRTTIDVVCDAGLSNIAQFVKQVYDPSSEDGEDIGGCYEPVKYSAWYKFNKYTDLSYWKTIVFKWNTFCKSIRKDCMFCTEGPRHLVLTGNKSVVRKSKKDTAVDINILPYLTMITGFNTSYGAGYLNWYKTVSDYTGDILWIPPSIIAAGTYIITDRDYNWWDAPAGQKRGVVDMADVSFNPTNKQAGEIYDVSWNYAINYQGHYINGIIQEGQKTFQSYHSAFDRINVRRLFLRCERYVYFASRAFLYEPNTAFNRERYVKYITPFFEDIKQRGGMYDYIIICDDSNNTPDTIDRNELRVKIGIQPVKTIEFILVDFVASRTGSDWSELATI